MEQRINVIEKSKEAFSAIYPLNVYLSKSTIEKPLQDLICHRVSQINGCAYCLDLHSKDLRAEGETEQRIYVLGAWRETPFYSKRERAALTWAEAVTKCDVPDGVYEEATKQFTEEELIDLTIVVNTINFYNRFNIAFKPPVGTYQVGQYAVQSE